MENSENIKNKIKSKGYWRVIIRPSKEFYCANRFSIEFLVKIIENSYVRLRGWPYPYFNKNDIEISGMDRIRLSCDVGDKSGNWKFIEYWEFTTSGQFSHIFAINEDYIITLPKASEIKSSFGLKEDESSRINKFLGVISTVYKVTEIFKFAANLVQHKEYDEVDRFEIIMELYDVKNRMLFTWDPSIFLLFPYICKIDDNKISFDDIYKKEELIANFAPLALEKAIKIFQFFHWQTPNKQILEEDQRKLLERRF
jgi:hypothetical protein